MSRWVLGVATLGVLLVTLSRVTGLDVTHPLPAPWTDPEACGSPYDPTTDLQNYTICDPDNVLGAHEQSIMAEMLDRCRDEAGVDVRVIVFLAASVSFSDDPSEGGKGNTSSGQRLLDMVVTSYDLIHKPSLILVVALEDPFQIKLWQSASLSSVLTEEEREEALQTAGEVQDIHGHFSTSVFRTLHLFCQHVHKEAEKFTSKWIVMTVTWVVFVAVFVLGVVGIAIYFIKARISRPKDALPPTRPQDGLRRTPGRCNTNPLSGDMHEFSAVSYRSTGHVLLGTSDITAVAAQSCSSTDNLLDV